MPRLTASEARHVRDMEAHLGTYVHGAAPGLDLVMEPLRELLATEKTLAYSLRERGETLGVEALFGARFPAGSFRPAFDGWLAGQGIDFACYDALRPGPEQRNVVISLDDLRAAGHLDLEGKSILREIYPQWGLAARDQLRVLVCDGPSLLVWLGAFQPEPFDRRQKRLLSALVPSLRRRLLFERQLGTMAQAHAALDAALEAIGRPAFVLGSQGAVAHANAAGQTMLERQGPAVRSSLIDAARGRPAVVPFDLTPLATPGAPAGYLALARLESPEQDLAARVASASARWGLTPRQRQALGYVARGLTNRTIAGILSVSERTVELHVTAIFDRAGAHNRAALVAMLFER
jgi:DNA-binding CsgD family transcriptional regulator